MHCISEFSGTYTGMGILAVTITARTSNLTINNVTNTTTSMTALGYQLPNFIGKSII